MKFLVTFLAFVSISAGAAHAKDGGVRFPINNQQSPEFNVWCDRALDELYWAKQDALAAYTYGNLADSVSILKNSLANVAGQTFPYQVGPLSYRAITRAMSYVERMESSMSGSDKDLRTLNLFLNKYIDYIMDVSEKLDVPHFNHRCRSGYCQQDLDNLEGKFVDFAFGQVENILNTLTVSGPGGVFPKGSAKGYLLGLNMATSFAIEDLRSSSYSEYYGCSIRDLVVLESRLESYNVGGPTQYWPSDVFAVRGSYYDASAITGGTYRRCHDTGRPSRPHVRHRHQKDANAFDLLGGRGIRLHNGTTENVVMDQSMYVSKIIVTAQSLSRNDGVFDVLVNGQIKGTIHFPGNDPSYVVTIAEHTDNVQFMSRNGGALISKVLVFSK